MALLVVENLRAGYGVGPDILSGLSLTVEPEKTHCIIGPNGAGKSTLLRVICGLLPRRGGSITFQGEPLHHLRTNQILRRGISLIPQERCLFPDMTVTENLRMGGYILKERRELERRIEEAYERFPILRERGKQLAKTLSGGEQRMLAIGRSLVLKPKLIMLDEPSLGLAPKIARQIFAGIRQMSGLGMAVVLVEQNARMGLECADWGHVLDFGRTLFEGPAETILGDPRIEALYLGKKRGAEGKKRS